jgi:hypothetical protein
VRLSLLPPAPLAIPDLTSHNSKSFLSHKQLSHIQQRCPSLAWKLPAISSPMSYPYSNGFQNTPSTLRSTLCGTFRTTLYSFAMVNSSISADSANAPCNLAWMDNKLLLKYQNTCTSTAFLRICLNVSTWNMIAYWLPKKVSKNYFLTSNEKRGSHPLQYLLWK